MLGVSRVNHDYLLHKVNDSGRVCGKETVVKDRAGMESGIENGGSWMERGTAYRMLADPDISSAKEDPLVKIEIQKENGQAENYLIHLNEVDVSSATGMEMFALFTGMAGGVKNDAGWEDLKYYYENAVKKGDFAPVETKDDFVSKKQDWGAMVKKVTEDYMESGFYKQALDGQKLCQKLGIDAEADIKTETSEFSSAENGEDTIKVMEGSIATLSNGISIYFNHDTGEMWCVDDTDSRPGRQVLWSRMLTDEDAARCGELFTDYRYGAVRRYKYDRYLGLESFWDMYLNREFDLEILEQEDQILKESDFYDKLFRGYPDSAKEAWEKELYKR